jgi:hypothetical protein
MNHLIRAGEEEVGRVTHRRHLRKLPEMIICVGENREVFYQQNTLLMNLNNGLQIKQGLFD